MSKNETIVEGDMFHATTGSAGYDLRSVDRVVLKKGDVTMVKTGVKLKMPPGCCALVLPRSGLSRKGVRLVNSPGLIDSDYRGEIMALLSNDFDNEFVIAPGDRIAQLLFIEPSKQTLLPGKVDNDTDRGGGGFGSTGVQ